MSDTVVKQKMPQRLIALLVRVNRTIAIVCGVTLLLTVALILIDLVLRQTPAGSLGGADEISGYVMAGMATWGFSYALTERAHVRIDLIQGRLTTVGKALLDILALASLAVVSLLVAYYAWGVLAKTITRDSRANTPLETPLWVPQSIWFAGWAWLSAVSVIMLLCIVALAVKRDWQTIRQAAGSTSEAEEFA